MDGWMDGWEGGKMDGRMGGRDTRGKNTKSHAAEAVSTEKHEMQCNESLRLALPLAHMQAG